MPCDRIKAWMGDHLDGCLDAARVRDLNAHLADCEACRREWDELRQTVTLIRSLTPLAPPADLVASVHQRLAAPQPTRLAVFWRVLNLPQTRVALAASVVILVGLYGWRNRTIRSGALEDLAPSARRMASTPAADAPADAPVETVAPAVYKDKDRAPIPPPEAPMATAAPAVRENLDEVSSHRETARDSLQKSEGGIWKKLESDDTLADVKRQPPGLSVGNESPDREERPVVAFAARAAQADRMQEAVKEPVAAEEAEMSPKRAVASGGGIAADSAMPMKADAAPSVAKSVAPASPLLSRLETEPVQPLQREIVLAGGDAAAARQILARYVVRAKTRERNEIKQEGDASAASRASASASKPGGIIGGTIDETADLSGWINAADYDRLLADLKAAGTVTLRPVEPPGKGATETPASESGRVWVSIVLPSSEK
jgi:anti-sigma factor RsiW